MYHGHNNLEKSKLTFLEWNKAKDKEPTRTRVVYVSKVCFGLSLEMANPAAGRRVRGPICLFLVTPPWAYHTLPCRPPRRSTRRRPACLRGQLCIPVMWVTWWPHPAWVPHPAAGIKYLSDTRALLRSLQNQNIFKIFRHIKFYGTCMKH